jgi:uncharacterized protein DUF5724/uncharacterized protein DUF4132
MLRREHAQEQLEQFKTKTKEGEARRRSRAAELPEALRPLAYGLLERDAKGQALRNWSDRHEARHKATERLEALSPEDRLQVWKVLFPRIAPHVEQAWQLHARLPYDSSYEYEYKLAFRAPSRPAMGRQARVAWLDTLLDELEAYEQGIAWIAAWALYAFDYSLESIGILLAGAIDGGGPEGEEVFQVLLASGRGEHEIGGMGRHVISALLCASRPEGWEFVERLLLAAQRQEGLRQSILESIDETHPEAFKRMLRLILQHDLLRFSAVIQAAGGWLRFPFDVSQAREGAAVLSEVLRFLEDPNARAEGLRSADGRTVSLALWSIAFEDAPGAVEPAARLLREGSDEQRRIAARFLGVLNLAEAREALLPALDDPDLQVALTAYNGLGVEGIADEDTETPDYSRTDLFERLERLLPRFPEKKPSPPEAAGLWTVPSVSAADITDGLVHCRGDRSPQRLIPYLPRMREYVRGQVVDLLGKEKDKDGEIRRTLFSLAGDRASWVRERVIRRVSRWKLREEETNQLEQLLSRRSRDLRQDLLTLLLKQKDEGVFSSVDRLLASGKAAQRLAGLELLERMLDEERAVETCRARAEQYRSERPRRTASEERLLEFLLQAPEEKPTLEDALGLMDPAARSQPGQPQVIPGVVLASEVVPALIKSLDDLIHKRRKTPIRYKYEWDDEDEWEEDEWEAWEDEEEEAPEEEAEEEEEEELLGEVGWSFPSPQVKRPLEEDAARLPLREVWEEWWSARPPDLRDPDGFELFRTLACMQGAGKKPKRLRYEGLEMTLLQWMLRLHPPAGAVDFLLDAVETSLAQVPEKVIWKERKERWEPDWRNDERYITWLTLAREHRTMFPAQWEDRHHARLWPLLRWLDEPQAKGEREKAKGEKETPLPSALSSQPSAPNTPALNPQPSTLNILPRHRPELEETLAAWRAGAATEADLIDLLLGPRDEDGSFDSLARLTGQKAAPLFDQYPGLREIAERCRDRVIEVELRRGTRATAATTAAIALNSAGGADTLVRLLDALGEDRLARGWSHDEEDRAAVLSRLILRTLPAETDTPEKFAEGARAAKIPAKRLVELAFYAPQWIPSVEAALGWPHFADAVWWILAHTRLNSWDLDAVRRRIRRAQVAERTSLPSQRLADGAVDLEWFHRVYPALGPDRWKALAAGARYGSEGFGHKRALLFADAILGRLDRQELVVQILEKRKGDALRAFGLLPLGVPGSEFRVPSSRSPNSELETRNSELAERYKIVQEFLRTSRKFGPQRRTNEKLAASIALENLARAAGYPDPIRLEWAMEARENLDLAAGPVTIEVSSPRGPVSVTLSINDWGEPRLATSRDGKSLKAIPGAIKKDPDVVELQHRKEEIKRQAARMRLSLEEAMIRGAAFTGAELRDLLRHPVLAPMLRNLVFSGGQSAVTGGVGEWESGRVGAGSPTLPLSHSPTHAMGYPVQGGAVLEAHDGTVTPVGVEDTFRIAHPYDLLQTGEWHLWQRDCFRRERIQPFKQVFRELYVLTEAEQVDGTQSRRYAGHQVNPKQAMALLGRRGWTGGFQGDNVQRTFHDQGLTARLELEYGWGTPGAVEAPSIENVHFSRRGEWKPLKLEEIPPRLFSEVMRDVDLVVSVAHVGGVDPEATASTVEMRTALLRETCTLLKLENVRLEGSHVFIDGQLGTYSVHLGSAVVHVQPGGHLCIVPVHSQHRGRIFLPFADNDPRTAEVVSKVLLLAKDKEIKDPTILEQILG